MSVLTGMLAHRNRAKFRDGTRPMRNKLHPSTIGMCERRIVFDMIMVPKDEPDDRLLEVFDNGHAMHEKYQKKFRDMGILLEEEMPLQKGAITGHADARIKVYSFHAPEGEEMLVELKSAAEYSFKWMKEKNLPKAEHRAQLQFYMHLSGITKGIILVENKDTQERWEYEMNYDEQYGNRLEQKANRCIDNAYARKLPDIPKGYTPSAYKCSLCDYNFYCHAGNTKKDNTERYPIPFPEGTEAHFDAVAIIKAMQNNETIPDLIEGSTNGDLAKCVQNKLIR